jgi:RHS repeat-associated protein
MTSLRPRPSTTESVSYLTCDHLNSPACSLSAAGAMQYRYEYDAGVPIRLRWSKRSVFNADYSQVMPVNAGTNIGFTGQRVEYFDNNGLELGYYKNRWYSPGMGRMLSEDPLGIVPNSYMNRFNPHGQYADGVNIYQYVGNEPVNRNDRLGLKYYEVFLLKDSLPIFLDFRLS